MKVGNLVNGMTVVDVKRVNKMNLIQFTKAVSEYIEQGYKLDVHSSRQVGLVLSVDLYKLESNLSGNVGSTGEAVPIEDSSEEEVVKEPNETTIEALQESTEKLETVETIDEVIEEALSDLKEGDVGVTSDETEVEVSETTPPVKKTRAKKTT